MSPVSWAIRRRRSEPTLPELVMDEHVKVLYRQMPMAIIASALCAALTAVVLNPITDRREILVWVALHVVVSLGRWRIWRAYADDYRTPAEVMGWARLSVFGSALSGMLWGGAMIMFFPPPGIEQIFLSLVVGGVCVGSVAVHASHLESLLGFVIPATIPFAARFLMEGTGIGIALAVLVVVFAVVLINTGRIFSNAIASGVKLRHELQQTNAANQERNQALQAMAQDVGHARDMAEAANHMKSEFLANMSHELRTPLNAIIGFSELMTSELLGPLGAPAYRDYASDILTSGRHLLDIVNDILDISKIEAGTMALNCDDVGIVELVSSCRRAVMTRALKGGLSVKLDIPEDLEVVADPVFLKRILLNLLTNAVKFTPSGGGVIVHGRLIEGDKPDHGIVEIAVSDTGIGMTPEEIGIALVPFRQVDGSLSRKHEGTGLGLPLAKSLTELHGGTLTVDSQPGYGTTVRVRLPRRQASETAQPDPALRQAGSVRA